MNSTHQTTSQTKPPRAANHHPKLLPSSSSFMSPIPFLQFSGHVSDVYRRHRTHKNVLLSVKIPTQQIVSQSDTGYSSTRRQKLQCSSSSSPNPDCTIAVRLIQQSTTQIDSCWS
ncbi:hypothetical protein PIB30_025351 [Stylosanthes scabra]|uniref:Uncharacterized protein n=1 Tax=Stylosanthes scabra TaxID=79078 RepID=A0ABU6Y7D3_9FABA|nr:hypothetical protein [Stylosanthes scabra]